MSKELFESLKPFILGPYGANTMLYINDEGKLVHFVIGEGWVFIEGEIVGEVDFVTTGRFSKPEQRFSPGWIGYKGNDFYYVDKEHMMRVIKGRTE